MDAYAPAPAPASAPAHAPAPAHASAPAHAHAHAPPPQRWLTPHILWGLVAVLAMGIGVRLSLLSERLADDTSLHTPVGLEAANRDLALEIANGYLTGREHLRLAALYPLVLGGAYRLVGRSSARTWALQTVLGLALLGLVFWLGSLMLSPAAGVLAAGLVAMFPPVCLPETQIERTSLLLILNGVAVAGGIWATSRRRPSAWLLAGLLMGLVAWARPSLLAFPITLAAAGLWALRRTPPAERRRRLILAAYAVLGLGLALTPLYARGPLAGDVATLLTPRFALEMYAGNHPNASGAATRPPGLRADDPDLFHAARARTAQDIQTEIRHPSEVTHHFLDLSLRWALSNPAGALRALGRKLYRTLRAPSPDGSIRTLETLRGLPLFRWLSFGFPALLVLALIGWWTTPIQGRRWIGANLCGLCALSLLTVASEELRLLAVPLLALLAAAGVFSLARSGARRMARLGAVALLAAAALTLTPDLQAPHPPPAAERELLLGLSLAHQGRPLAARRHLQQATRRAPTWRPALTALAQAELAIGHHRDGRHRLERIVRRFPRSVSPRLALARDALRLAERSSALGNRTATTDWIHQAAAQVDRARQIVPDRADVMLLAARLRRTLGHLTESARLLLGALRRRPAYAPLHVALGEAAALQHNLSRARAHFDLARMLGGTPDPTWIQALKDAALAKR